ncbi:MAG: hypothetical protein LW650_00070 [Planctomycetaceae bacterium]|nr:hypothetical protein [Phycisphaerales bacterium]MCE2651937.1 hypothetical protein [Planctomycetaceae bacterium]
MNELSLLLSLGAGTAGPVGDGPQDGDDDHSGGDSSPCDWRNTLKEGKWAAGSLGHAAPDGVEHLGNGVIGSGIGLGFDVHPA